MPDLNGVLTQDERSKIDPWFQKNWIHRACPICSANQWSLADHVVMPTIYNQFPNVYTVVGIPTESTSYPQIMVVCHRCGLTLYFSAIKVGILGGEQNAKP
jgi:hypothetical protein